MATFRNHEDSSNSLVHILHRRVEKQDGKRALTFLADGEREERGVSYDELHRQARIIGALLQRINAFQERALLLYPPGLEFVAAVMGCQYAGVVAVPVSPPNPTRLELVLLRLQAISSNAQASIVLTTKSLLCAAGERLDGTSEIERLQWLSTDDLEDISEASYKEFTPKPDTLAMLQYTSGSTGTPKGVKLTHGNLLYNLEYIRRAFRLSSESISVTWLPSFHDMGLIDGILGPLYNGYHGILMSPLSFLDRPLPFFLNRHN